jgi:cytoskeletal protein RodZ
MERIDLRRRIVENRAPAERGRMQRRIIFVMGAIILLLVGVLAVVLWRGQPRPTPPSVEPADVNAAEPYHREMDCIDRLLQNNNLNANEVEPALARCHGGSAGNQSIGQ